MHEWMSIYYNHTGRSVACILHHLNSNPFDWYSKKMTTIETATCSSTYGTARTCGELSVGLQTTLKYLRVPLREKR